MNHFIEVAQPWGAGWSAGIWRASMEGAIAIAVVWIINRIVYLSPRVTCWLWRAVCLKLLVALFWTQPVAIAILPQKAVATTNMQPTTTVSLQLMPVANETPYDFDVPTSPTPPIQSAHHITIGEVLAITWSIGVVWFVIFTVREWLSVRRICRNAAAVFSPALHQACQSETARLGVRRLPQLRFSSRVDGPLLAGIGRPTIILPDNVEAAFDQSDVRLMLAHELAHLKRCDLMWNWLPTVVGWLFYFHPLVWLLRRSWFESQEAACDELLLQNQVVRPSEYGRLLLKLSSNWSRHPRASLAAAGVLGAYRNLERRIVAMSRVKTFSHRRVLVTANLLLLFSVVIVIPWRLVAQEQNHDAVNSTDATSTKHDRELQRSANNLNQIVSAILMYVDAAGHYPPVKAGWGYDRNKREWYRERPYLSWRVLILPMLGQKELFSKFKLNEPWDSENNRKLILLMPAIYRAPGSKANAGKTNYLGVVGPNAAFPDNGTITVPDFIDGTSKTILLVEVPDDAAVEWTRPEDFPADANDPMSKLVGLRAGGFLAACADSCPYFISKDTPREMLENLLCRNDRKPFNDKDWKQCMHDMYQPATPDTKTK
jgi:beta-lactamase regulating signal transducer with metallopeptidase domain